MNSYDYKRIDEISKEIIDFIPTGISIYHRYNNKIKCIAANCYFADMIGVSKEKLIGEFFDSIFMRVHPDDREQCIEDSVELLPKNRKASGTYRIFNLNDEQYHWFHLDGQLFKSSDGNEYAFFIFTNVDTIVNRKNAFNNNFQALQSIIQYIPGGVFVYSADKDNVFSFVSDNMLLMLGYSKEEFDLAFHTHFSEMVYIEDRQCVVDEISRVSDGKLNSTCSYRIRKKDGSLLWVHDERNIVTDYNGKHWIYSTIVDITDSVNENNALTMQNNELKDIINNIPASIIIYRKDKENISIAAVNGYLNIHSKGLADSLIGIKNQEIVDLVHPDDKKSVINFFNKLYSESGDMNPSEIICRTKLGQNLAFCWYHCRAICIPQKDDVSLIYAVYTDASYQKAKEIDFHRLMQNLLSSNENSMFSCRLDLSENRCINKYGKDEYISLFNDNSADNILERVKSLIYGADEKLKFSKEYSRNSLINKFYAGRQNNNCKLRFSLNNIDVFWVDAYFQMIQNPYSENIETFIYFVNYDLQHKKEKIINCITEEEYDCIGIINVNSGKIKYYYLTSDMRFPKEMLPTDYESAVNMIAGNLLSSFEREQYLEKVRIDTVIKKLEEKPVYIFSSSCSSFSGTQRRKEINYRYLDEDHSEIMFCFKDITDTFEHEEENSKLLRTALNAAQKANQLKSDFLGNVSHDMRTPLNAILGYTRLSLMSDDPREIRENLKKTETAGNTLLSLINDTLDLQKIENGIIVLNPKPINCRKAIQEIIANIKPMMDAKNITLEIDTSRTEEVTINVDMLRLREIFINLLSNAAKFTPNGGKVDIIIECIRRENGIAHDKIVIKDNGIGMTQKFQAKMFEPFSQERTKETAYIGGSGLGLSIVYRLVELMNGRIEVESEIGKGTSFTVYVDFERIENFDENNKICCNDNLDISGIKVLLCEDNKMNTEIAKRILEKNGATVVSVSDGLEGSNRFISSVPGEFDIILMDIRMPVMDGYAATFEIRNSFHPQAKTIPIIAMTADAYAADIEKAFTFGMNGHISKPINIDNMIEEIVSQLKNNR